MVVRRNSAPAVVVVLWKTILHCDKRNRKCDIHQLNVAHTIAHSKLSGKVVQHEISESVRDKLIVKLHESVEYYQLPPDELVFDDGYDWYCYSCHRGGDVKLCTTCWRVFHERCAKSSDSQPEQFVCHICKRMSMSEGIENMTKEKFNAFLGFIINRLRDQTEELYNFDSLELGAKVKLLIYKPMDLDTVLEKFSSGKSYSNLQQFYEDILLLVHNVCILYGVSSEEAEMAKCAFRECETEIETLFQCFDCYYYSNMKPKNWFSLPCEPAHDLVLARIHGYPFWPAKVLSYNAERKLYTVRFFGGKHERSENLPESQIKPLVDNHLPSSPKFQGDLREANIEVKLHQKLLLKASTDPLSVSANGAPTSNYETEGRSQMNRIKGMPIMEGTTEPGGSVKKNTSLKTKKSRPSPKTDNLASEASSSSSYSEQSTGSSETGSSFSVQYKPTVDATHDNIASSKEMKISSETAMTLTKTAKPPPDTPDSLFVPDKVKSSGTAGAGVTDKVKSSGTAGAGVKHSVSKTPVSVAGSQKDGVNTPGLLDTKDSVTKQDRISSSGGEGSDALKQSVPEKSSAVTRSRTNSVTGSRTSTTVLSFKKSQAGSGETSLPVQEGKEIQIISSSKQSTIASDVKPVPVKRSLAFDAMTSPSNNRDTPLESADHESASSSKKSKITPPLKFSSSTPASSGTHRSNGIEPLSPKKFDVKPASEQPPVKKIKMTPDTSLPLSEKVDRQKLEGHSGVGKDVKSQLAIRTNGQGIDEKRGGLSAGTASAAGKCYSVTCREEFQKELGQLRNEFNSRINELVAKISDTKKRQWCRFCEEPSRYECCWNTSYCSQSCQYKDWPTHKPHHRSNV